MQSNVYNTSSKQSSKEKKPINNDKCLLQEFRKLYILDAFKQLLELQQSWRRWLDI